MSSTKELLKNSKVIAVVGCSDRPFRDSYHITEMLIKAGYTVYPVNPTIDSAFGLRTYPDVQSVPEQVDIVDVFRNPRYAKEVVQDAIAAHAKSIWFQLGAENDEAEQMAEEVGLEVVANHCIAVEYRKYANELR